MKYSSFSDIPQWAKAPVERMIISGILQCEKGQFEMPLNDEMLFIFVILARIGMV